MDLSLRAYIAVPHLPPAPPRRARAPAPPRVFAVLRNYRMCAMYQGSLGVREGRGGLLTGRERLASGGKASSADGPPKAPREDIFEETPRGSHL